MSESKISILFFGTPEFAVPSLEALFNDKEIEILGIVSQTSKPKGRGGKIQDPAVLIKAKELGIHNLFQPRSLKKISFSNGDLSCNDQDIEVSNLCNFVNNKKPDFNVVIAYGKIIPDSILATPKITSLNVHPSSLPKWRGAAPLQYTIFSGTNSTKICIIELTSELDAGPIYNSEVLENISNDSLQTLHDKTSSIGAKLLVKTIKDIYHNKITPIAQSNDEITYANKWLKNDCKIDWNENSLVTYNRIRACSPKPGAFCHFENKVFKIINADNSKESTQNDLSAGQLLLISETRVGVFTGDQQIIELLEVQIEGKSKISAKDFLNTNKLRERLRSGEPIFLT